MLNTCRERNSVEISALPEADDLEASLREYPDLFSGELGTLKGVQYDNERVDDDIVTARLHSLKSCEIIEELLGKKVIRPTKSPCASTVFWVSSREGDIGWCSTVGR